MGLFIANKSIDGCIRPPSCECSNKYQNQKDSALPPTIQNGYYKKIYKIYIKLLFQSIKDISLNVSSKIKYNYLTSFAKASVPPLLIQPKASWPFQFA